MIRVGGGAGGDHAAQIAGHDDVGIGAANTGLGALAKGIDPARPHNTDAAGQAHVAESALGLLGVVPLPNGFNTVLSGLGMQRITILGDGQLGLGIEHLLLLGIASAIIDSIERQL